MAISFINKKYISVSNTTDGLNNMLADIVDLICKNTGVSIINKIEYGGCYLRKLVAPDSAYKLNFYLWYSPVTETPVKNSFFSVGNDVFLLVYPSMITYAIKV